MADEWKTKPLFEVADVVFGYPFDSNLFQSTRAGLPLIRIRDLRTPDTCLYTTETEFPESVRVESGDLLVGMDAEFRTHRWAGPNALLNQRVCKVVPKTRHRLDREFLRVALRGPLLELENSKTGTTVIHLNKSDLERVVLPWPESGERRAIAHILGTLDEKIELNRRMNETLEAMARELFQSWFVDFDPVRAKAEGRDPGLPKTVADLFPARFVDSELGEIPEGWEVRPIGDLAEVVGGSTPKTERVEYWEDGTYHWVTPKDLSALSMPVLLDTERKITEAGLAQISSGLLPKGTVLLSSRAPIGYLAIAEVPVAVNQGFIAMKPRPGTSNLFLLRWASAAHDDIVSHANGSTFLEISKSSFRPIRAVAPATAVMHAYDRLTRPMYLKVAEHERETRTLAALRDSLLPKLISGEMRVKDAERYVSAAT